MTPLIVLIGTYLVSLTILRITSGQNQFSLSARIAMAVMLGFTAIGHFLFTKGMAMMIPGAIPFKTEIVYVTGFAEIILGVALLFPFTSLPAARTLVVFFLLVLPSNIHGAIEHIDYSRGTFDGPGPAYLWFRVPLQILFILWLYYSSIRQSKQKI